jgi:hypothetical protein
MQGSTPAAVCQDGCCTSSAYSATDAARFGLPGLDAVADDPTLASCCAKDLAMRRKSEALKQALSAVDRSTARLKLAAAARPGVAPPEEPGPSPDQEPSDDLESGDDDEGTDQDRR